MLPSLSIVPKDRVTAGRVGHEPPGRVFGHAAIGRLAQVLEHLAGGGFGVVRLGHELLTICTARLSDLVLSGLLGVSGSRTVAVPTHAFTRLRSVVFV